VSSPTGTPKNSDQARASNFHMQLLREPTME
jgi:hypothetical protein